MLNNVFNGITFNVSKKKHTLISRLLEIFTIE